MKPAIRPNEPGSETHEDRGPQWGYVYEPNRQEPKGFGQGSVLGARAEDENDGHGQEERDRNAYG